MQQGVVGLSVFFSLLMFIVNREPEGASSRFDSGVSILVAAFVRPGGWIRGRLVLQRPSRPVLYCSILCRGRTLLRAGCGTGRHLSCNGREAMSPRWREEGGGRWRVWLAVWQSRIHWPFCKAACCVYG